MPWEETFAYDVLNRWAYLYHRNRWMLDLSRFWQTCDEIPIDRPIFLLGMQGGGLTLVSRMLRRHREVVSVTGNHRYWAGADEMQNVYWPILPPKLTGLKYHKPHDDVFTSPRGWVYATDALLEIYRNTNEDVTSEDREQFRRVVRWSIRRTAPRGRPVRFTDKSQLFTVKVSYIDRLLDGCNPKFLLMTRNPYALCYRSTDGTRSLRELGARFDFAQRLEFAAQHWANSVACAQQDGRKVKSFMVVRFEDVLRDPERQLRRICDFVELEFVRDMLPHADHRLPFGSMRRERWYPVQPEVNERHLRALKAEHADIIARWCEPLAEPLGYERPRN